ncbi:MAG TPA: hypothetical protein VKT17_08275, partial [Acidobacteriota bacterium]|nr:hypothetical protein [Acidobacteriota bacterium]
SLYVPPSRNEVTFGESRVWLALHVEKLTGEADLDPKSAAAAEARGLAWTGQINDRYEDYARVYPALHELREAAKVLALAKWILREKIAVRTGVRAEPVWQPPAEVPGLIDVRMSFGLVKDPDGKLSYDFRMPVWMMGGVNFKIKNDWVVQGPKPPSYVPVGDQLTTSAALGEQAAQAALSGDLESARALSELSAQALTGDLDPARLPSGAGLAKAGARKAATPEDIQLVRESLQAIRSATGEPSAGADAASPAERTAFLTELRDAFRNERSGQAPASDSLARLRTRRSAPPTPPAREPAVRSGDASFDCAAYLRQLSDGADLGDGPKGFLDGRIREIQEKLEIVRKAMEELGRLRQGDLKALETCTGQISAAYADAQDRALDAATLLLVDGPLEILKKRRDAIKGRIDQGLRKLLSERSGVLDEAAIARLDRSSFDLFRAKYGFENVYGRAERLQKTLTAAKSLYDMGQWADSDKADFEKLKDGTLQLVEMFLGDETLGPALKLGKFTGDTALRFLSLYKISAAASGFFWDIMAQKFAWDPLVDELQRSLET